MNLNPYGDAYKTLSQITQNTKLLNNYVILKLHSLTLIVNNAYMQINFDQYMTYILLMQITTTVIF